MIKALINIQGFIALMATFMMGGCQSCTKAPQRQQEEAALLEQKRDRFTIDAESIFKSVERFSYKSELVISVGRGEELIKTSQELIDIVGSNQRMMLRKKTDESHVIELFKDGDEFLVRNQNRAWRSGKDNKSMYKNLLKDGFNLTAWVVENFGPFNDLPSEQKKRFSIKNASVSQDSLFIKSIASRFPPFALPKGSAIDGTITVDERASLPVLANFDILITGQEQHWIKVSVKMALDMSVNIKDIARPEENKESSPDYPVNIAPRLNELLGISAPKGESET